VKKTKTLGWFVSKRQAMRSAFRWMTFNADEQGLETLRVNFD
jgi:hypothetical protein